MSKYGGQIQYRFNKNDEYYTPAYAVYPIKEAIPKGSTIWCPFDTEESNYVKAFEQGGYNVIFGHIETGQDFFEAVVPECDYIISNPPYSLRNEIFERLYKIGKPFAMLINFQGIFDHRKRFEMFRNNRVEMLWLSPRVDFIKPDGVGKNGVPFQSGYLCSGIFDNQLNFKSIDKRGTINI